MSAAFRAPVRPRRNSFHYDGITPAPKISWVAVLFALSLHASIFVASTKHQPPPRVRPAEEIVEQIQMMPDLKDLEDEKPVELNDEELAAPMTVSVPTLADLPMSLTVQSDFTQQLDLTIPLKSDASIGNMVTIPVNIRHGRPDASGIKNLFNVSELDRAPEPVVQPAPSYPFELKREGIEGRVRVGFIVTNRGDVIMPYVVMSTNSGFERAALEVVVKWKFRPGMKNGRKVNTRVEQPMDFTVLTGS